MTSIDNPIISIKNISLTIEKKNIFKNFSLDINTKGITVIFGPNGSGKTLLTKIIVGMQKIQKGTIKYKKKFIVNPEIINLLKIFLALYALINP